MVFVGTFDSLSSRFHGVFDDAGEGGSEMGEPAEFRSRPGRGHTLMVGDLLPEAIDFLLAHPRQPK